VRGDRGAVHHQWEVDHERSQDGDGDRRVPADQLDGGELGGADEHDDRHRRRLEDRETGTDTRRAGDEGERDDPEEHR
jgi:hypothetical protein